MVEIAGLVSHGRNTSSSGCIRSVAGTPTVVACCTGGTLIVSPGCGGPDDYCRKPPPRVCWPPDPPYYVWGPPEIHYPHGPGPRDSNR